MRVIRWLVGLVVLGFVVGLVRPHRTELPRPVTR